MKFQLYFVVFITLAVSIGCKTESAPRPIKPTLDVKNVIYQFYDALNQKDCEKAVILREKYSEKRCKNIANVEVKKVDVVKHLPLSNIAIVDLQITYEKNGDKKDFSGYTTLKKMQQKGWIIADLYGSMGLKEYTTYISKNLGIPMAESNKNSLTGTSAGKVVKSPKNSGIEVSSTKQRKPTSILQEQLVVEEQKENEKDSLPDTQVVTSPKRNNTDPNFSKDGDPFRNGDKPHSILQDHSIISNQNSNETTLLTHIEDSLSKKLTFGSQKILEACWTQPILQGTKADRKIQRPIPNPYSKSPRTYVPSYYEPPVKQEWQNSIRRVVLDEGKNYIALTFDLCERLNETTGYDAEIVNYLRKHKIKATFYAGGKWMHSHPDKAMQLMADPLFEIGNHAWTHGNMRVLKGEEVENQILWTQGQYQDLRNSLWTKLEQCSAPENEIDKIPLVPHTFRFPYGTCSKKSLNTLASFGLPAIQWDVVTADPWKKQTAKGIAKIVLSQTNPGSIIIAHANGRGYKTVEALPLFIPELRKKYKFVTVSELLAEAKTVIATETCYELKPGDNKRYDKIFGKGTH